MQKTLLRSRAQIPDVHATGKFSLAQENAVAIIARMSIMRR
jgi:hypothetical protein